MNPIFEKVNSRLWIKIMLPVSVVIILAMGISLWFNVKNQKRLGMDQLDAQNQSLTQAVEGGCSMPLPSGIMIPSGSSLNGWAKKSAT